MSTNGMLFPSTFETFDAQRHTLALREIALAFDRDGVREVTLADAKSRHPEAEYPCAMRALIAGEHDIGWGEKLLVSPEDVAMCVVNGNALIRDAFVPLLFDHGFTGKGTESPGDVLEFFEQNGDLWALVDLADEEMFAKACKPGKRWKSRSLGFGAWVDAEGRLRPAQPKELSLTNLPRLKGLGKTVEMAHVRQLCAAPAGSPADLSIPTSLAAASPAAPLGLTQNAASGGEGSSLSTSPISSPVSASARKEEHMKVTPETLKLLGLAENASEDDLNRRLAELAAPKAEPEPKVEAPAPVALSAADVDRIVAEKTAKVFAEMAETNAKALAEATEKATKKARVDAVLSKAVSLGKLTAADVELYRPAVEANPDGFEARLGTMPTVAPVATVFEKGDDGRTLAGSTHANLSADLTYAAQFARLSNISVTEAQRRIAAARAN